MEDQQSKQKANDSLENPPKRRKTDEEENISQLEELCLRFPFVSRSVFKNLDNESLIKCKTSGRIMNSCINNERSYWIRILKKWNKNFQEFSESWKRVICKTPIDIVKKLAITAEYECDDDGGFAPV